MVSAGGSGVFISGGSSPPWLSSISAGEDSRRGDPECLGRVAWDSSGEGFLLGSLSSGGGLPLFCGGVTGAGCVGRSHMVAS